MLLPKCKPRIHATAIEWRRIYIEYSLSCTGAERYVEERIARDSNPCLTPIPYLYMDRRRVNYCRSATKACILSRHRPWGYSSVARPATFSRPSGTTPARFPS